MANKQSPDEGLIYDEDTHQWVPANEPPTPAPEKTKKPRTESGSDE